jgi:hypothetical protein
MAISKRKLAANRANAQKSTGPTSSTGKETISQNSRKHGLCGAFKVLEGESQTEYDDLLERFLRTEQPADDVERELVAKMVRHTWLSERAVRVQEACFLVQPRTAEDIANGKENICVRADLDLYLRYQAAHDRAYQRAAHELAKRRKERLQAEVGFVSQKRAEAQEERREKQQAQRDELHTFKVATAAFRLHGLETRYYAANSTVPPPDTGLIVP